jgi:hypothetical protein
MAAIVRRKCDATVWYVCRVAAGSAVGGAAQPSNPDAAVI